MAGHRFWLALLGCLVLLGFAATYGFVGGSHAATRAPHRRPKKKSKPKTQPATPLTPPRKPVNFAKPGLGAVSPTVLTVSEVNSSSSSMVVPLALGLTFGLSVVLVGLALAPFRVLPSPVRAVAYDRREPLLYTGIVIYITTGVSLVIALLLS